MTVTTPPSLVPIVFKKDLSPHVSNWEIDVYLRQDQSGEIYLTDCARNWLQTQRKNVN